ncbi:MAG TPA: 4Fe-4S binding protein [Spirochaetia bacterium]|nr:4Fe-4S binding protein [Spirochaetia bacterium]
MAISAREFRATQKTTRRFRLVVIVAILVFLTALGILHQFPIGFRPPGVDALCPFGGLEAVYGVIAAGTLMEKIAWSSFILLGVTVVVALVFRRSFCGNVCPLGTLQELTAKLGKKLFRRRFTMPAVIDRPARYLKYLVLVVVVALSAIFGELIIRPYDPWAAYQHIVSKELFTGFLIGLIVLVASLAGSLFYDRFFCKYMCPMGAFLGLVSKLGWYRIRRDADLCTSCGACDKACPVNLKVATSDEVKSAECLSCNQCVLACPVKGALEVAAPTKKKRTTRPTTIILATVSLFVAVVAATAVTGQFNLTIPTITETIEKTGSFDPADIKGSDTFADVAKASGLSKEAFMERFALSDAEFSGPIKDAAHRAEAGFETQDVRDFITQKLE